MRIVVLSIIIFLMNMAPGFCDSCPTYLYEKQDKYKWFKDVYRDVLCDYSIYYGKENLPWAGGMLLAAGVMANSRFDHSVHHYWQKRVRSSGTDTFFKIPHGIGSYNYIKFYLGSMLLGFWYREDYLPSCLLYHWGYRALRAMLILSPQEVFLSNQIGNGRPYLHESSHWRVFKKKIGKAGCSGHAFNGAVPFLTAAFMTEEPVLRYTFFALSTLPGLCRINDNRHFASQVFIGWCLSFLATRVVDLSDEARAQNKCEECLRFYFTPVKRGVMLRGHWQL